MLTYRKYIRMDIFVMLLLISLFSSLLAYNVFVWFFMLLQAYFEGEFFVCNTLNRCMYTQQIYFSHFLVTVEQTGNPI